MRRVRHLLWAVRVGFLSLGYLMLFGGFPLLPSGALFACPYTVPYLLCGVCPIRCGFGLVRNWLLATIFASTPLLGRAFCGLLCPLGTLGRLLHRGRRRGTMKPLRLIGLGLTPLLLYLMVEATLTTLGLKPFSGIWLQLFIYRRGLLPVKVAVITLLLILSIHLYRTWCQLCPFGLMLGASNRFSLITLEKSEGCRGCGRCLQGCPTGGDFDSEGCYRCLDCYSNCEAEALILRLRLGSRP